MKYAARAIIIKEEQLLVVHRRKYGSEYFTLVGGFVNENESIEQALVREVKEETGLNVTAAQLVFIENHAPPYNKQYIYYCEVAPFETAEIQADSEEGSMNKLAANTHRLMWANISSFDKLAFRTPQLQQAIRYCLKYGFPSEAQVLSEDWIQKHLVDKKSSIFGRILRR